MTLGRDNMFKIAKLKELKDEKVTINYIKQETYTVVQGKTETESFKTLSFDISAEKYSFSFDLNCRMDKLLEIPTSETVDFKDYIFNSETWLNIKGSNSLEPEMDIKITRYLKNRFAIYLKFFAEDGYDSGGYSGEIEFSFNLDEYNK